MILFKAGRLLLAWLWTCSSFSTLVNGQNACSSSPTTPTTITVSGTTGDFQTSTWPANYTASLDCYYLFTPDSGYGTMTFTFIVLDTEASGLCADDYLNIYDGSSTTAHLMGTVCDSLTNVQNKNLATFVNTVTSQIFLHFHSDGDALVGQGVHIQYIAEKNAGTSLSTEQIIGITVGCGIAVILIAVIVAVVILKKKRRVSPEDEEEDDDDDSDDSDDSEEEEEEVEVSAETGQRTVKVVPA